MAIDDAVGDLIEGSPNFVFVRSEDFTSLLKHLQAFEYRHEVLEEAGFDLSNDKLGDLHMSKLVHREQTNSVAREELLG